MQELGKPFRVAALFAGVALGSLVPAGAFAGAVRQLTDVKTTFSSSAEIDDAGTVAYAASSTNQLGANGEHVFQIFRFDPVTGTATQVTSFADGVAPARLPTTLYDDVLQVVSVSDDGLWLAFISPSDPLGTNPDQSPELFVMRDDGTQLAQLTNDPAPNAGSVIGIAMAGSANRIAFVANTDPLGTNLDDDLQLFVIDRDGTGLVQLTQAAGGIFRGLSISDDGQRIAFSHEGDLTGGNGDLEAEIFAVLADGTDLRQLTASPYGTTPSTACRISGDGSTVVFESFADLTGGNSNFVEELFAVDWDGTNLNQVTDTTNAFYPITQAPTITDDGQLIVYHSNHRKGSTNSDGNFEVIKITRSGSGLTFLSSDIGTNGNVQPVISGSGNRVVFHSFSEYAGGNNPDESLELHAMNASGGGKVQLTAGVFEIRDEPDITQDGTRVVFVSDPDGSDREGEVYVVDDDGTGLAQVTNLASGGAARPSIAADGMSIVFSANSNPTGGNGDVSEEVFFVRADGTGLLRLTDGAGGTNSENPVISSDGSTIVFDSDANLTGGNNDDSREIFRVLPGGGGLVQLTSAPAGVTSRQPRIDDAGNWVVFESEADFDGGNADNSWEVWRVRSDGTGLERLTGDPAAPSRGPDVSGSGARVVYASQADPLSSNADGNFEIFLYEPGTAARTQITNTTGGSSLDPRISGDGRYAYFLTDAMFEDDPDRPFHVARADLDALTVERSGALGGGRSRAVVPGADGSRATFSGSGDFTEANPDNTDELWLIDWTASTPIRVHGPAPTALSWEHLAGPLRYDAIRGDVADLQPGAPGTTDLGTLTCLENDSPDADTVGDEDPDDPSVGQAFFYLFRGSSGLGVGPGSYGESSNGDERQPGPGDCTP